MKTPSNVFKSLANHCIQKYVRVLVNSRAKTLTFKSVKECAIYDCELQISPDNSTISIRLTFPLILDDPKMLEHLLAVLAQCSKKILDGSCFTVTIPKSLIVYGRTGETRFIKSNVTIIDHDLFAFMTDCDTCFSALMRVKYGGHAPEEAVFLSELESQTTVSGKADLGGDGPTAQNTA